ncbi:hypothetical protein Tco_1293754 [Tanacetum coccineum]
METFAYPSLCLSAYDIALGHRPMVYIDKMLQRCEDTNLCLNWEKSHFMVKEGIVLGHKISKNGIEVDIKTKSTVIAKLLIPPPSRVFGVFAVNAPVSTDWFPLRIFQYFPTDDSSS